MTVASNLLLPSGDGDRPEQGRSVPESQPKQEEREHLPYIVELLDSGKTGVELVLAVTANGSIGFAAYYAAAREYPERCVVLRHKNSIIAQWNGRAH